MSDWWGSASYMTLLTKAAQLPCKGEWDGPSRLCPTGAKWSPEMEIVGRPIFWWRWPRRAWAIGLVGVMFVVAGEARSHECAFPSRWVMSNRPNLRGGVTIRGIPLVEKKRGGRFRGGNNGSGGLRG